LKDIKNILRKYDLNEFYLSYLKQVADEKKELIYKRIELFTIILEGQFNEEKFNKAWLQAIQVTFIFILESSLQFE
jgi:hypothetical protein